MTKSFLTTAALVISGSVAANAADANWEGATWDGSRMTDTETEKYSYTQVSTVNPTPTNLGYTSLDPNGVADETKYHFNGTIDFGLDARYELTFEATHTNYTGSSPASALFTMVNDTGSVSLMFGNSSTAMGQLGIVLGENINTNTGLDTLISGTAKSQVYTAFQGTSIPYANGTYQYRIVFETFSDNSIDDKIYFEVINEANGNKAHSAILAKHLGCGGYETQKFTDLGFTLNGDKLVNGSAGQTERGQTGVYIAGNKSSVPQTMFTAYERTLTVVPEPSAFGLLAGIGALALVASRRRRK